MQSSGSLSAEAAVSASPEGETALSRASNQEKSGAPPGSESAIGGAKRGASGGRDHRRRAAGKDQRALPAAARAAAADDGGDDDDGVPGSGAEDMPVLLPRTVARSAAKAAGPASTSLATH